MKKCPQSRGDSSLFVLRFALYCGNFSLRQEELSQAIVDKINPISNEIKKLLNEKDYLDKILLDGHTKANEIATQKLKEIHKIIGF